MWRALQLAEYGLGSVSPNPMVGCVIVSDGKIIGEGWHRNFGQAHAEVEAVNDARSKGHGHLLAGATAYVTLEPCSHFGKTPPCADLLIDAKIAQVVIANVDPNPVVAGRGIARLEKAGVKVTSGVLADKGAEINKRFFCGMVYKRPYIILKWAESRDGYLGFPGIRTKISGSLTDLFVHKWRAEEDAILVGKNTVITDNPRLNVRHWIGKNPVRIVLDRQLASARQEFNVFHEDQPSLFVNYLKGSGSQPDRYQNDPTNPQTHYLKIKSSADELNETLTKLFEQGIGSILVEGGAKVTNAFIEKGLWDEMRIIKGDILLGRGIKAPRPEGILSLEQKLGKDRLYYFNSPK